MEGWMCMINQKVIVVLPPSTWLDRMKKSRESSVRTADRQGRDTNPGHPEYEAGELTTGQQRSVIQITGNSMSGSDSKTVPGFTGSKFEL
jgi:hypothetical protein